MDKKYFLGKLKDSDDRDRFFYIEKPTFDCGHYFGSINVQGACYSGSLIINSETDIKIGVLRESVTFEDIETTLTFEELKRLSDYNVTSNVYGLDKNKEKYDEVLQALNNLDDIFEKLVSDENLKLLNELLEEEKEMLMHDYRLTSEEVDYIRNEYYLDYKDASIVSHVYVDAEDVGREMYDSCYYDRNDHMHNYIDFEKFGNDIIEGEGYLELEDGRIIYLNY